MQDFAVHGSIPIPEKNERKAAPGRIGAAIGGFKKRTIVSCLGGNVGHERREAQITKDPLLFDADPRKRTSDHGLTGKVKRERLKDLGRQDTSRDAGSKEPRNPVSGDSRAPLMEIDMGTQ